jgi:hypothetical protein
MAISRIDEILADPTINIRVSSDDNQNNQMFF